MVVTRFAPSPTGLLHLGNVRTALLNWLYARKHDGRFLLRFEDTDRVRSSTDFADAIVEDLTWLGLTWDGTPSFQFDHSERYRAALDELAEQGLTYRCFCTAERLSLDRRLFASHGLPPRYAGHCRELSPSEAACRSKSEPFVWRLAASGSGEVSIRDVLRGSVRFSRADLDDPVIVRSDGSFTFLLPNAVDDALDGITHVLRGDDHLTNTAYQAWLLEALGHAPPVYLHHGLLLNEDGAKLSKRTGSHDVRSLRAAGLLPAALVQAMTRLGHPNIPDTALDLDALVAHFEPERLSTSAVRWTDDDMWRWHARLLHQMPAHCLTGLIAPLFPTVEASRLEAFARLVQSNLRRVEDAKAYARLLDAHAGLSAESEAVLRQAGADFFAKALETWQQTADAGWAGWTGRLKEESGCSGRALFLPLRAALTGAVHGPEMARVIAFLGRQGVQARLEDALAR